MAEYKFNYGNQKDLIKLVKLLTESSSLLTLHLSSNTSSTFSRLLENFSELSMKSGSIAASAGKEKLGQAVVFYLNMIKEFSDAEKIMPFSYYKIYDNCEPKLEYSLSDFETLFRNTDYDFFKNNIIPLRDDLRGIHRLEKIVEENPTNSPE